MIKIYRQLAAVFLLISLVTGARAQSADEIKKIFMQAESYFLYEEYELANQLFLLIETPDNMNIKHKIGTCYLNIPGEKEKSVAYLEEAVKSVSADSKTESLKELKAPQDVWFSLAKAYMINNEFDKAINTLNTFQNLIKKSGSMNDLSNYEFIAQQIQACKNAIQYRQFPVSFLKQSLGDGFFQGSVNENPAVSYDGNVMVYTERRGIENAIFFSVKRNGKWEPPVEITAELNAGADCSSTALNSDGTELYLYKTDNYDGAIYSSKYVNGKWSPIVKLNRNINTKYYESHASVSADGNRLYFSSNREGGLGNLDIYVSEKDKNGNWGPAVNLGKTINTPFNEDTPFITSNDSLLFFSSEGHNSIGGYDIFRSAQISSGWREPSNLGYPVNSADDDRFFLPVGNGSAAYYSLSTGYKQKEIFQIDLLGGSSATPYTIAGKISTIDSADLADRVFFVRIISQVTGDTLYKGSSVKGTGTYSMNVAPGLFRIIYSGRGFTTQSVDTVFRPDSPVLAMNIDVHLEKDLTAGGPEGLEKIDLSNIPLVSHIDSSILIKNLTVKDEGDKTMKDSDILYYTVQVIALHKPVDVSYFRYINDLIVMYNDNDKFYRYTTGKFENKEEAYLHRLDLIKKGYTKEIFIKKVSN